MKVRIAAALLLLGVALAPVPGRAVEATPVQASSIELSGYDLRGRGSGVLVSYDIPERLPISPILDVATPDVQASVTAGPTPAASSSLAYPGPLILSLDTVFAQFGGVDNPLPAYPAIVRAPTAAGSSAEDTTTVPGGTMAASAEGASASATAVMPTRASPAVAAIGTVSASSTTSIDGAVATTHVRVEVEGVDVLGGLVHLDGLVTDLTVTTDGVNATTSGGTTFAGASALGLPVVIDATGIRFADEGASPPTTAGPLDAVLGPLGGSLDAVGDALAPLGDLTAGVTALLTGDPAGLDALLQEIGVRIRVGEPVAEVQGPAGSLRSAGLAIDFSAELDATPLGQLLDVLPPLPELPGSPFQPADLVAIVGANHVSGVSIGSATATATARPLPVRATPDRPAADPTGPATPVATGGGGTSTGTAARPSASSPVSGGSAPTGTVSTQPAALELPFADLVGWRMVVLAVAAALVASLGTRKLPDLALAPSAARHCALGTAPERSAP